MKVFCDWSGGKDSTTSVFLHLERGDDVTACCYIPYLNESIPLINRSHFDFLMRMRDRFVSMGANVLFAQGISYYDFCLFRKANGRLRGYPFYGDCFFRRFSKSLALRKCYDSTCDTRDVGYAFDEVSRYNSGRACGISSILVDLKMTENDCFNFCSARDALSPVYSLDSRDGCVVCPHSNGKRLNQYLIDYPGSASVLLDIEYKLKADGYLYKPFRNGLYFSDFIKEV